MTDSTSQQNAIAGLLGTARTSGKPDPYIGKRRWTRYQIGVPFEVTLDPMLPGGSWRVITHNISGGGIGFWSKHSLAINETVFVRPCGDGPCDIWIAAKANYCVLSVNGFLIGLAFDHPAEPDTPYALGRTARDSEIRPPREPRPPKHLRVTFRRQCAYACGASSGVVAAFTIVLSNRYQVAWLLLLLPVVSSGFGIVMGWALMWREAHLLSLIQHALFNMSSNQACLEQLPEASTREVDSIRQEILDLGLRWKQHAEASQLQRQRLEEINQIKSNILSMVSHDLRTPLTSIQLYAQMLQEDLTELSVEDQQHFLDIISEECMRLSRLVDDLLEVQRLEGGAVKWRMTEHDMAETIHGAACSFEPVAAKSGIDFRVDCVQTLPKIQADADKLSQVVGNLVSNAMKFVPAGGVVHLSAEAHSNGILVKVGDNGPGIPREKWDFIFDRFSQLSSTTARQISGAGLGLHIVRQIVEYHGGIVYVDSQVGQGAEFTVFLPYERSGIQTTDQTAVPKGSVIVCDADPELAARMSQALRRAQFDVRVAHCGARLAEHLAHCVPDVVLTDICLPDMTASDLLASLRESSHNRSKLIVHSFEGERDDLERDGAAFVLQRPATMDELVEAVQLAVQTRSGRGATVMLVDGWGIDCGLLSQHLSVAGHVSVIAADSKAAAKRLREYPVDFVIVKDGAEGYLSKRLRMLTESRSHNTEVVILTDCVENYAPFVHENEGVSCLRFKRGDEDEIADAISTAWSGRKKEVCS